MCMGACWSNEKFLAKRKNVFKKLFKLLALQACFLELIIGSFDWSRWTVD